MNAKIFDILPSEAKEIREEVFIREQGFLEEYDKFDDVAVHIVVFDCGEAVATCRVFKAEQPGVFLIGRLAVRKQFRKRGIGSMAVKAAENYVLENGGKTIVLHSQLNATGFYKKQGFTEFGDVEYEEDCPHIYMKKDLC